MNEEAAVRVPAASESLMNLAREIQEDLKRWAKPYPSFDPGQFFGIALTSAAHLQEQSRSKRLTATLVSAWILTFDGLIDECRVPQSEWPGLLTAYKAIVRGDAAVPQSSSDDLAPALHDIRQRLTTHSSFTGLSAHWYQSFDRMVDAIVWQRYTGRLLAPEAGYAEELLPSYDALMERALHSVGVPFYLTTCLILNDDSSVLERLPVLIEIAEECARAIRLANDLRTWEREEREQTINTVVVIRRALMREHPDLSPEECRDRALHILKDREMAAVARTHTLLASSPESSSPVEAGIGRLVNHVTGFYALQDYRTFNGRI